MILSFNCGLFLFLFLFLFSGFIRGPGDNPKPVAFSFHNKFKQGPLLTVVSFLKCLLNGWKVNQNNLDALSFSCFSWAMIVETCTLLLAHNRWLKLLSQVVILPGFKPWLPRVPQCFFLYLFDLLIVGPQPTHLTFGPLIACHKSWCL